MKKFGKFVFGTLSLATLAAGAYFVYKNFIKKDISDDFEEFEDDFDDFDDFDSEEGATECSDSREYVPIQIDQEDINKEDDIEENTEVEAVTNDTASTDAQDEYKE